MNSIFISGSSLTLCDLRNHSPHMRFEQNIQIFKGLCDSVPLDVQPVYNLLGRDRVCQCKEHMWKEKNLEIRGLEAVSALSPPTG